MRAWVPTGSGQGCHEYEVARRGQPVLPAASDACGHNGGSRDTTTELGMRRPRRICYLALKACTTQCATVLSHSQTQQMIPSRPCLQASLSSQKRLRSFFTAAFLGAASCLGPSVCTDVANVADELCISDFLLLLGSPSLAIRSITLL